jgi:hypothetical protein
MIHFHPLTRRHALRSAGAIVGLPFLESFGFRRCAAAASTVPPPKRLLFLGFGWGVTNDTWFPDPNKVGADYVLPEGLAPLKRHQADITIVQGCINKFSSDGHSGSTFWLTGADQHATRGRSFSNTISADQVAAQKIGSQTRFSSLQLGCKNSGESGHGRGTSMAWDADGKSLAGFDSPRQAYRRLFFTDEMPAEQRKAMLAHERSVLDLVLTDAKSMQRGLSRSDADKVNEYFQGIREIERRLSKDEEWMDTPLPKPPFECPEEPLAGKKEIQLMYDLIVAAFQSDVTRVATYRQPVELLLRSLGITRSGHDISHYGPGNDREAGSRKRDITQSELLAGLIDKLKATKEADGTSLFDHVALAYGSNIRMHHNLDNCPTLLAGGGAGITLGQHVVLPKNTPLCNVWLTLLHGLGVKAERHGDSTGIVSQLVGAESRS